MVAEDKNNIIHNLAKLKWACRRGMLELDVLLGNFLQSGYANLADDEKKVFVDLLSHSDPELIDWLMGHATPEDKELATLVAKIRAHVRANF